MSLARQTALVFVVVAFTACGTALYHHAVSVSVVNTPWSIDLTIDVPAAKQAFQGPF